MTINQLENEIRVAENAYKAEIAKNGGMDGSTRAFRLKTRLKLLKDLKQKYYS